MHFPTRSHRTFLLLRNPNKHTRRSWKTSGSTVSEIIVQNELPVVIARSTKHSVVLSCCSSVPADPQTNTFPSTLIAAGPTFNDHQELGQHRCPSRLTPFISPLRSSASPVEAAQSSTPDCPEITLRQLGGGLK